VGMTIRSGHAPVYVRAMLCEAIEYGAQHTGWWEWFTTDATKQYPWEQQETKRWIELDARGRARWFTTQLWNCGDIVPANYLAMLKQPPGLTYAQVVSWLRRDIAERATASASGERG
jgi:hypothetical protein